MRICLHCQQPLPSTASFMSEGSVTAQNQTLQETTWKCCHCGFQPLAQSGVLCFAPEAVSQDEGFNPHHFEMLATLEEGHFWYMARNKLILWGIKRYFPKAAHFFEVGCGTGFVIAGVQKAMPGMSCYGSEIFPQGLVFAKERLANTSFWQMDARHIPFVDEFDVVGAFDVIEHIEEDEAVLRQIYQATKPGGGVLITVPQHKALWSKADVRTCHVRRYEACELREKVQKVGFEILDETSFVSLLVPLMWLSRKLERDTDVPLVESSELDINPILNKCFYWIMLFEQLFIKVGTRFSIGGSRLLVARKPVSA